MSDSIPGVQPSRVQVLNDKPENKKGDYVLYWMQGATRVKCNQALAYAIHQANKRQCQLVVCIGVMDAFPEANARHYTFFIEGIRDVAIKLKSMKVPFLVLRVKAEPYQAALTICQKLKVIMVISDMQYLRIQREWRTKLTKELKVKLVQVETETVVPIETASKKLEFAARTLRPKLHGVWSDYFVVSDNPKLQKASSVPDKLFDSADVSDPEAFVADLPIDHKVKKHPAWIGGEEKALAKLSEFIKRLHRYDQDRNDPLIDGSSQLSMYLHFGQISPVLCCVEAQKKNRASALPFVEEIVVRRELSFNHVWYCPNYDSLDSAPDWAKKTMDKHAGDKRPYLYDRKQLEARETHDECWNAAQGDMMITGRMPNYLRMYWGKKIIEWSKTYEDAWDNMAYLNNKYEIDGRDANSWTNFAWCFGSKDRPWFERDVFGQLRYMAESSLRKKYNMVGYIEKVQRLEKGGKGDMDKFVKRENDKKPKEPSKKRPKKSDDEMEMDKDDQAPPSRASSKVKAKK